jgi:hypothetical protein
VKREGRGGRRTRAEEVFGGWLEILGALKSRFERIVENRRGRRRERDERRKIKVDFDAIFRD